MKTLNGYKIEFYSEDEWNTLIRNTTDTMGELFINDHLASELEYAGLVSNISEELCTYIVSFELNGKWVNYNDKYNSCNTANESFQTLSDDLPYCVITKIN